MRGDNQDYISEVMFPEKSIKITKINDDFLEQ
jgi:hypothetical protein